jgi:hypothetical protein
MYIKLSEARSIFKLTSHRPPRPVFILLWRVMLTAKVLLLGQKQAALKLGPGCCAQYFWGPSHSTCVLAHAALLVRNGLLETLGSARACVVCLGWDDATSEETAWRRSSRSWRAHK